MDVLPLNQFLTPDIKLLWVLLDLLRVQDKEAHAAMASREMRAETRMVPEERAWRHKTCHRERFLLVTCYTYLFAPLIYPSDLSLLYGFVIDVFTKRP